MIPAEPPPFLLLTRREILIVHGVFHKKNGGVGSIVEMKITFTGQESPDRG